MCHKAQACNLALTIPKIDADRDQDVSATFVCFWLSPCLATRSRMALLASSCDHRRGPLWVAWPGDDRTLFNNFRLHASAMDINIEAVISS